MDEGLHAPVAHVRIRVDRKGTGIGTITLLEGRRKVQGRLPTATVERVLDVELRCWREVGIKRGEEGLFAKGGEPDDGAYGDGDERREKDGEEIDVVWKGLWILDRRGRIDWPDGDEKGQEDCQREDEAS